MNYCRADRLHSLVDDHPIKSLLRETDSSLPPHQPTGPGSNVYEEAQHVLAALDEKKLNESNQSEFYLEPVLVEDEEEEAEDEPSINISDLNPNNLLNCSSADFEATINHLFQL